VEKSGGGRSRTHRQEVKVQSGSPGAAERSVDGVTATLTAGKADRGIQT
jgi:hypothetical protein